MPSLTAAAAIMEQPSIAAHNVTKTMSDTAAAETGIASAFGGPVP